VRGAGEEESSFFKTGGAASASSPSLMGAFFSAIGAGGRRGPSHLDEDSSAHATHNTQPPNASPSTGIAHASAAAGAHEAAPSDAPTSAGREKREKRMDSSSFNRAKGEARETFTEKRVDRRKHRAWRFASTDMVDGSKDGKTHAPTAHTVPAISSAFGQTLTESLCAVHGVRDRHAHHNAKPPKAVQFKPDATSEQATPAAPPQRTRPAVAFSSAALANGADRGPTVSSAAAGDHPPHAADEHPHDASIRMSAYKHTTGRRVARQRPQPKNMTKRGSIAVHLVMEMAGRTRRAAAGSISSGRSDSCATHPQGSHTRGPARRQVLWHAVHVPTEELSHRVYCTCHTLTAFHWSGVLMPLLHRFMTQLRTPSLSGGSFIARSGSIFGEARVHSLSRLAPPASPSHLALSPLPLAEHLISHLTPIPPSHLTMYISNLTSSLITSCATWQGRKLSLSPVRRIASVGRNRGAPLGSQLGGSQLGVADEDATPKPQDLPPELTVLDQLVQETEVGKAARRKTRMQNAAATATTTAANDGPASDVPAAARRQRPCNIGSLLEDSEAHPNAMAC
jgi:hypothetical protein